MAVDKREEARLKINEIDEKIRELFCERMTAARVIGEYKKEHGLPIEDKAREAVLIARNSEKVPEGVIRDCYVKFQKGIMDVSKDYQRRIIEGMKIAYSGVEGAFAWIAAKRIFPDCTPVAYSDFSAAYSAVENGEADAAVLPIENSYAGDVGQVMDLIFSGSLFINGMYELPVNQHLLTLPNVDIMGIKKVYSHPQALSQCAPFIKEHGYEPCQYFNTAAAAKFVSESGDCTLAAIGSDETAALYGLRVAERNIQSDRGNTTRFAVLCRSASRAHSVGTNASPNVHCVLNFTVRNEAGSLAKAIGIIGKRGYNMRMLCSRPMKKLAWQYYLYVEAEGDIDTGAGMTMLEELGEFCDALRVVGQFVPSKIL